MRYLFHGICLQNRRPSNMDSLLLKSGTIRDRSALLAVVCDGVGSMADGAFASGEAVRMLNDWFDKADSVDRAGLAMRDAALGINSAIIRQAKSHSMDTATTLSALLLIDDHYYITHIGDSRIYCFDSESTVNFAGGQALSVLTNDDVSESGQLTACIGQTEDVFPQCAEGKAGGKTFVLCSDGLYKRMDASLMMSVVSNWDRRALKEPLEALTRFVIERGEPDNITVAFVKIE